MRTIAPPAGRLTEATPEMELRWQGFDLVNPAKTAIARRLDFEPVAAGPFAFLHHRAAPQWTAIDAQGQGVDADMIPGRQGFTADLRLSEGAAATIVLQVQGTGAQGAWRLWQTAAWEQTIAQAMLLRGLFAGALIAAAAWLTGLAILRFAAAPFWGAVTMLCALTLLLGSAGLAQIGAGGLLFTGAAFAAASLKFTSAMLELQGPGRTSGVLANAFAAAALALAAAAMFIGDANLIWAAGIAIQAAGALSIALVLREAIGGAAKAKALIVGAAAIAGAAAAPALVTPDLWRDLVGWPLILDGAFVLGLLIVAFAATAPRRPPISEDEAAQLIDERQRAKDAEYRYALGLAAAHQGLWDWNIEKNTLYVSSAVEALLGLTQGALGNSERNWAGLVHPEDMKIYEMALNNYKAQGNASFVLEVRMRHARGQIRWMQIKASMIAGRRGDAIRCIGVVSDVTDLKQQQEKTKAPQDDSLDAVTGLPARASFLTRLDQVFAAVASAGMPPRGVVMAIDVDRVKAVAESMGEPAGERFLKDVAARIQSVLGPADVLARVGSEEFALLLLPDDFGKTPDTAVMRVRDALSKAIHVGRQDVFPAVSVGAVALGAQHKQGGDALREAEVAMHHAKRGGAGGYEVFKPEMKPRSAERLSLDADLRRALERNQIEIAFQPIVALREGGVAGFEALMRWRHHQRGLIAPVEFIPLAEETGLIVPLGSFMLQRAAEELGYWRNAFQLDHPLFVSVNVSPRQLFRADFTAEVEALLKRHSVAPGTLKLEVTETVVMRDVEKSVVVLNALKKLGVGLSLDDFGTGYSSLSYLHRLPFDTLKIDRTFVTTLTTSQDANAIVSTIMAMAANLKMSVIAEGVESQPEAVKLAQLGCDFAQGFLFGAAMDARGIEAMLSSHAHPAPAYAPPETDPTPDDARWNQIGYGPVDYGRPQQAPPRQTAPRQSLSKPAPPTLSPPNRTPPRTTPPRGRRDY